jgi:hypothetical protein
VFTERTAEVAAQVEAFGETMNSMGLSQPQSELDRTEAEL